MPLSPSGGKTQYPKAKHYSSPFHLPGLDGLRALAVLAVLLYHSDMGWMPAGFLGVEVFFVVSGYLITWLLLSEWQLAGGIDLKQFWMRRARRLLPALFVVIGATLAFAIVLLPEEVAGLRGDVLAALGYVTNWYLIFAQKSYFEAMGRPSLLQHLWSLAVEEQFYLLWPLLLVLLLRWWQPRRAWLFALGGALLSAALMALLYQPDIDPSRVYYGTDTRAAGLLIGAALAFLWQPGIGSQPPLVRPSSWALLDFWRNLFRSSSRALRDLDPSGFPPREDERPPHDDGRPSLPFAPLKGSSTANNGEGRGRGWPRLTPLMLDAVGLLGLGILIWSSLSFDEYEPALYFWGFSLVAVTTAMVILIATHPRAHLGSFLDREPLRWIGQRSYGIYLWYWPVFDLTRPHLDIPLDGFALFALRIVMTVGLAALSFRFVETPIRRGALGRAWATIARAHGRQHRWARLRVAGSAVGILLLSIMLGGSVVNAQPTPPPEYLSELSVVASTDGQITAAATFTPTLLVPATQPPPSATPTAPATLVKPATVAPPIPASGAPSAAAPIPGHASQVTAIGDSVMLGAVGDLQRTIGSVEVDAQVGRQVSTAIADLSGRRAANRLGAAVVIHIGNNGPFSARQFQELMAVLTGVPRVVIVNDNVPRAWEASNNTMLATVVKQYPNVILVDWHAVSADHPEYFWKDGIHLRPAGAKAYADLINAGLTAR